ncbi:MAG TPA: SAM-dependent methyltransferase [Frankiaceae bacterium]|nr:SAM-dependent methyltransferase [Frankiaceae bacterium]
MRRCRWWRAGRRRRTPRGGADGGSGGEPADRLGLDRPSAARMYDYHLGGSHNFAVDRQMAEQAIAAMPDLPLVLRANRSLLRRAVQFLAAAGVDQFLDLGSGIPTVGNVHEIAQRVNPRARVVYVDVDPVAVAHSQRLLADNDRAGVVQCDLRHVDAVLHAATVTQGLDLGRPVAVLLVAVLHFLPDADRLADIVRGYWTALASGSYVVISHASHDARSPVGQGHAQALCRHTATPLTMRSHAEVAALVDGLEPVPPGLVRLPLWRPDGPEALPGPADAFPGWTVVARRP